MPDPSPLPVPTVPTRSKKKIILCCDGTGNDFIHNLADLKTSSNSNVVKLYTALSTAGNQCLYYHPGVGTMGAPTATHWLTKQWTRIKGLAFGAGFRDNVFSAYRFLMEHYSDNGGNGNDGLQDEIYVFGFSRGSYTARALLGLLQGYGLLCPGNEDHLPYAWRMFTSQLADPKLRNSKRHSIVPNDAFRETYSQPEFPIQFVGLWDTVSSVGWIYTPLRLLNIAQNHLLQTVRHAVSIDEHRCFYQDNLYGDPIPSSLNPLKHRQDILQVWFPGVHSDVGGSYGQRETWFSVQALEWMIAHAQAVGLTFIADRIDLVLSRPTAGTSALNSLYSPPAQDPPKYNKLHDSLPLKLRALGWWYLQFCPHRYYDHESGRQYWRVPFAVRRIIPTGSIVHPIVREIMHAQGAPGLPYAPPNLKPAYLHPLAASPSPIGPNLAYDVYLPPQRGFSIWHWAPVRWTLIVLFGTLFWSSFAAIACIILAVLSLPLALVLWLLHSLCACL